MEIFNYKKTQCVNGCNLFNDDSNYLYWENRDTTSDEISIPEFINKNYFNEKLNILHVGIGNSYIALNINNFKKLDGISISGNEIAYAKKFNIKNYDIFFLNKFTKDGFHLNNLNNYDIIIDVNLKSFSCCKIAFENLFSNYISMLRNRGKIITGKKGMNWSRQVRPVITFSFKKFFHKKLKEIDGPKENILKIEECYELCKKYKLKLNQYEDSNLVTFQKLD